VTVRPLPKPRQALLTCVLAATAMVASAALFAAAALAPAPPGALPLLIAVCIGCPLLAAWELPIAVTVLRVRASVRRDALTELRARLADLPETEHPLGY
jgi:hypothetical protein